MEDMFVAHSLGILDHDADDENLFATTAAKWREEVTKSLDVLQARSRDLAEMEIGHEGQMAMVEVQETQYTDVGQPFMVHWEDLVSRRGFRVRLDVNHKPIFATPTSRAKTGSLLTVRESFLNCVMVHPAVGIRMLKLRKEDDARPELPAQMVRLKLMWGAAAAKAASEPCLELCDVCCLVGCDMLLYTCPLCTLSLHDSCSSRVLGWMQREWDTHGMRLSDAVAWPWERVQASSMACVICQFAMASPGP